MVWQGFISFFLAMMLILLFISTGMSNAEEMVLWKFETGGAINASPIVHEGILYIGSFDKLFYAIDALTGVEKWHFETGRPQQPFPSLSKTQQLG